MSLRTWYANKLKNHAERVAVKRGDGIKKTVIDGRSIQFEYTDPDDVGPDRHYDPTHYNDAVLYLGDNANPTRVTPSDADDPDEEFETMNSKRYRTALESHIVEKFFGGNLERLIKLSIIASGAAALFAIGAIFAVVEYAG